MLNDLANKKYKGVELDKLEKLEPKSGAFALGKKKPNSKEEKKK
jgi:hypothetical protein